jgi:Fur family ferric uptake transcriptional regulator
MTHHSDMSDEQVLQQAGIRVTAVRLMIWRQVRHGFADAFSLADLEAALPTVDRSTLFRTLSLLSEAHLLHDIDDGSGSQKYCVCHHDDTRQCMGHVHLTCRLCHRTYCLPNVRIPQVPLPEGFIAEETEYVVKGICPHCALRQEARGHFLA